MTMLRTILLLSLLAGCAKACSQVYTHSRGLSEAAAAAAPSCHFTHAQAGRDWKNYDKECSWTCGGKSQSPTNLPLSGNPTLNKAFKADTRFGIATNLRVLNLGHAVQVEFDSPKKNKASVVYYGDSVYTLYNASHPIASKARRVKVEPLQFHFHLTSEHLLSGQSTEMELHIVTKLVKTPGVPMPKECPTEDKSCLAVFGVMYDLKMKYDAKNGDRTIQTIIISLPRGCPEAGRDCVKNVTNWELDLSELLPGTEYLTYTGSLTTPPCTEGVMWHVFPRVMATMTQRQAIDLQNAISTAILDGEPVHNRANNREVQKWNGRTVYRSA